MSDTEDYTTNNTVPGGDAIDGLLANQFNKSLQIRNDIKKKNQTIVFEYAAFKECYDSNKDQIEKLIKFDFESDKIIGATIMKLYSEIPKTAKTAFMKFYNSTVHSANPPTKDDGNMSHVYRLIATVTGGRTKTITGVVGKSRVTPLLKSYMKIDQEKHRVYYMGPNDNLYEADCQGTHASVKVITD